MFLFRFHTQSMLTIANVLSYILFFAYHQGFAYIYEVTTHIRRLILFYMFYRYIKVFIYMTHTHIYIYIHTHTHTHTLTLTHTHSHTHTHTHTHTDFPGGT